MKTMNPKAALQLGSLMCVLFLLGFGTGCSGKGSTEPSAVLIDEVVEIEPASASDNTSESDSEDSREVTIAKCLSSKGAVLYGASWCTYSQQQIASFKDGFQYLSYVECTEQDTLCTEKGITVYPTWIIGGSRLTGYRVPTRIGSDAGCAW